MLMSRSLNGAVCVCLVLVGAAPGMAQQENPLLVPWPKHVELQPGTIELGPRSRIITADPALLPLANILVDEIHGTRSSSGTASG
jgi:hypothetical protein